MELDPYQPTGNEMVGPFPGNVYYIVSDGKQLPYLRAYPNNVQATEWSIIVRDSFSFTIPQDILHQVIPLLADAMAVAAGYKSHHDACDHQRDRYNPFGTAMIALGELSVEDES